MQTQNKAYIISTILLRKKGGFKIKSQNNKYQQVQ